MLSSPRVLHSVLLKLNAETDMWYEEESLIPPVTTTSLKDQNN